MELFGKGSDKSDIQRISDELTGAELFLRLLRKNSKNLSTRLRKSRG